MSKFIVLYRAPASVLDDWMKTPPAEREVMESKMKVDWDAWATKHAGMILETAGAGATTTVSPDGAKNARNDIMMYSLVEAPSREAVTEMFVGHPHLGIPQGTIDIMSANLLPGMQS